MDSTSWILGIQHLTSQNGRNVPQHTPLRLTGQAFAHKEAPDGPGGISVSAASDVSARRDVLRMQKFHGNGNE